MQAKRGWIIGGAVLLQIMLLAAAFSLGVYLERHGFTREGLSYQRTEAPAAGPNLADGAPGQPGAVPPQQGGQPNLLPPGLDTAPDVLGRIVSICPQMLDLATEQGRRTIATSERTTVRDAAGQELTLRNLEFGMIVAVYGSLTQNGRALLAEEIVILPPLHEAP